MKGLLVAAFGAAALAAGACRTVRISAPVDLRTYSKPDSAMSKEFQPFLPIAWLRLPPDWKQKFPGFGPPLDDLPWPAMVFWNEEGTYGGGVFYAGAEDLESIRKHELHDGFGKNIDEPSLARTWIDGRQAFIIRGHFPAWGDMEPTTFQSMLHTYHFAGGDVVMAVVPLALPWGQVTVVVVVASAPGLLSRNPARAFEIFATCRFRKPRDAATKTCSPEKGACLDSGTWRFGGWTTLASCSTTSRRPSRSSPNSVWSWRARRRSRDPGWTAASGSTASEATSR